MVLLDAGWDAINLGANTPLSSFQVALKELKPRLVWLSASYLPDPQRFLDEYGEFYKLAAQAGIAVAVGGQAFEDSLRAVIPSSLHGTCLTDLATFARTLHSCPRPPKRGRPVREGPEGR